MYFVMYSPVSPIDSQFPIVNCYANHDTQRNLLLLLKKKYKQMFYCFSSKVLYRNGNSGGGGVVGPVRVVLV